MPLVRVNDSTLLDQLIAALTKRPDAIIERHGESSVLINLMGSYNNDAMQAATLLRVRAWEDAQRANGIDVRIDIEVEQPSAAPRL